MEKFNYSVIDTETSVKCPIGNNKANPHWPDNKIVMFGVTAKNAPTELVYTRSEIGAIDTDHRMWVGTNLPFDLQYLYKEVKNVYNNRGKLRIWDCQVAQYLLSRQRDKYASLDDMSVAAGGTLKDDRIKKHWDSGGQTEDIDPLVLEEYLKNDVKNTKLVFKKQTKEAVERGMLPLIMAQMDAVLAVTEMEYNGIKIDKAFVVENCSRLAVDIAKATLVFRETVNKDTKIPLTHIIPSSLKNMSLVFFGGYMKTKKKENVGFYKNGNPKIKSVDANIRYDGYKCNPRGVQKTTYGWTTNDETLETIKGDMDPKAALAADLLMNYRRLCKDYDTYFEPLSQLIFPDGCVHQNLNQTSTDTGRLSCSSPNLQNQTDKGTSEIKKAFVSRWGDQGQLVEFDYKQLEIVALAELSGDENLIRDINNGVDIHAKLYKNMYGEAPTTEERKQFKRLSFALIYGAGIKNMATRGGVNEAVAKHFRETFFDKYPKVKDYRKKIIEELAKNRVANGHGHDALTCKPLGSSHIKLPTGRELYYREYVKDTPAIYTKDTDFSYTQICNYPVQSFATGDIVPIMFGKLWRCLVNSKYKDKVLLINTVHDSILLDIHKDVLEEVIPIISNLLETVPETMEHLFGLKMTTRPKVSVSAGPNWYDMKELKND